MNLLRQIWTISDFPGAPFPNTDAVGDTLEISTAVAHVLARTGPLNDLGNRTSVLFYTPEENVTFERVTFQCNGGGPLCSFDTLIVG